MGRIIYTNIQAIDQSDVHQKKRKNVFTVLRTSELACRGYSRNARTINVICRYCDESMSLSLSRCNMNVLVDVERGVVEIHRVRSIFPRRKIKPTGTRNNTSSHLEVVRETDGSGRCSYARRRPNTDGNYRTPTINPPRFYAVFLKYNIDRECNNGTMKMHFPIIGVSKILFSLISWNYIVRNIVK